MLELRFHPIKNQFVAIATKRQNRTFHPPKDFCPLCPTKNNKMATEIPANDYDIVVFENKFPTLSRNPDKINRKKLNVENVFSFNMKQSEGICEVVCYTSSHDLFLEDMQVSKISNLIKVWSDRYQTLGKKKFIKYVLIFENKEGSDILLWHLSLVNSISI